jgi:hypothetical protein
MFIYQQSTGKLFQNSTSGPAIDTGYSGHGEGKNNPTMEAVKAVGPIPCGMWKITGVKDSANTGPFSILLEPVGHDAHGRTLFRMHGDSASDPGNASHGCIIMRRVTREYVMHRGDRDLKVTP